MTLLGNTALLVPIAPDAMSPGGIYYQPRYRDDRMQYYVVAVGPGKRLPDGTRLLPEVRPGDRCLCNPDTLGTRHTFDDGRILVDADCIEMVWT